jgi:hypothetical protein
MFFPVLRYISQAVDESLEHNWNRQQGKEISESTKTYQSLCGIVWWAYPGC